MLVVLLLTYPSGGALGHSARGVRTFRMSGRPPDPPGPKPMDAVKLVVEKGFPVGKQIMFGLFTRDVNRTRVPTEEERVRLREQAASELAVISADERQRRTAVGYVGGAVTAAVAAGLLIVDAPPVGRAALILPIWLFIGYVDSGKTGL